MRKDLTFVAPQDTPVHGSAERLQVRRIGRNRGHLWEQLDLPLWLARNGRPPLVSLCNTAPLIYRNQIATHHDITYVRHPESYSRTFARCLQEPDAAAAQAHQGTDHGQRLFPQGNRPLLRLPERTSVWYPMPCRRSSAHPPRKPAAGWQALSAGRVVAQCAQELRSHGRRLLSLGRLRRGGAAHRRRLHSVFSGNDYRLEGNLAYACSAASTTSSWCANTGTPPHSSFRRSTKASAYRRWRRRPVAAR